MSMSFPLKNEPLIKLVSGLNCTEGDPNDAPIHRRTDHWFFEESRSRREGQGPFAGNYNVTEQTYYRRKSNYGGMSVSEMRRLTELESENQRLKKLVTEKELHIDALKEVVKKILSPRQRRSAVEDLKERQVSER